MQTLFKELKVSISFQTTLTHTRLQRVIIGSLSLSLSLKTISVFSIVQTHCWHLQQNCLRNCDLRSLTQIQQE